MSKENLNYVALKIIEILEEKMPNDTAYIGEKIERLNGFADNKVATLMWAYNQLDGSNLNALCKRLDITPAQLQGFKEVLQKL
ncbi:hypothetical protein [Acinetobacter proteolyticus]|uniref:Uncharacterized protein n=1 Tax=Acinetobacter proteolyticus TaxID=1776741 RepID=A0A2N0WI76_9GAMM|nr:hypothetical protein [Acinetobacter proteolyticus]PKF35498.1 hypothetical protein CW311_04205 [Acinetobacter proteolyticus]